MPTARNRRRRFTRRNIASKTSAALPREPSQAEPPRTSIRKILLLALLLRDGLRGNDLRRRGFDRGDRLARGALNREREVNGEVFLRGLVVADLHRVAARLERLRDVDHARGIGL